MEKFDQRTRQSSDVPIERSSPDVMMTLYHSLTHTDGDCDDDDHYEEADNN